MFDAEHSSLRAQLSAQHIIPSTQTREVCGPIDVCMDTCVLPSAQDACMKGTTGSHNFPNGICKKAETSLAPIVVGVLYSVSS